MAKKKVNDKKKVCFSPTDDSWKTAPMNTLTGVRFSHRKWYEKGMADAARGTTPYETRRPKKQNHEFLNTYWEGFDRATKLMQETKKGAKKDD